MPPHVRLDDIGLQRRQKLPDKHMNLIRLLKMRREPPGSKTEERGNEGGKAGRPANKQGNPARFAAAVQVSSSPLSP